ncbi:hypothetical protein JOQ06_020010 [Pogonophryne albipinna]|uniref:HECT domain-containing protein n=1 Tax=Pogonophryne albipinna TaxID=1090488 RepID=A0AAD6BP46_9TELE|nr:hypothetical protein JOQ06_020010 [Pogonophryne albipinna]
MQEELDTTPLLLTDEAFSSMHKATCQKCGAAIPLQLLTEHIKSCNIIDVDSDENLAVVEDSCEQEWLTVQDPTRAISQFRDDVLSIHESKNPLLLSMDIRSSPAEQDAALICFYKKLNVEWGRPLKCRLEGDAAIGEGVSRFFFSTCMDKLNSGFCINFASPDVMANLVKFWTGWEILPRNNLSIEVVNGSFPTASTCYETLRIPGHYKDYASFENVMLACIGTCQTGFDLV